MTQYNMDRLTANGFEKTMETTNGAQTIFRRTWKKASQNQYGESEIWMNIEVFERGCSLVATVSGNCVSEQVKKPRYYSSFNRMINAIRVIVGCARFEF